MPKENAYQMLRLQKPVTPTVRFRDQHVRRTTHHMTMSLFFNACIKWTDVYNQ